MTFNNYIETLKPKLVIQRYEKFNNTIFGYATYTDKSNRITLQCIENSEKAIKAGTYSATKTFSPRFNRELYLINVDGREGIRIHPANWGSELEGCIALGTSRKGNMVINSKLGVKLFHAVSNGQSFNIEIRDEENLRKNLIKVFRQAIRSVNKWLRKST